MITSISPGELAQRLRDNPDLKLLDVRTPAEFREVHVRGASNLPMDQLDPRLLAETHGNGPLYVICQGGGRSAMACQKLATAGLENIVDVAGGTAACVSAGLPVERGRKTISLERQVRITAGSLVLLGVVLAYVLHPYFALLSAFIGGGLLFSGLTNTCGMGNLLARMPWNQSVS